MAEVKIAIPVKHHDLLHLLENQCTLFISEEEEEDISVILIFCFNFDSF